MTYLLPDRPEERARMAALFSRVAAVPMGQRLLDRIDDSVRRGQQRQIRLSFDAQIDGHGVFYKRSGGDTLALNPRDDDALLASALFHELRHSQQPGISPGLSGQSFITFCHFMTALREGDCFAHQLFFAIDSGDDAMTDATLHVLSRGDKQNMQGLCLLADRWTAADTTAAKQAVLADAFWHMQAQVLAPEYYVDPVQVSAEGLIADGRVDARLPDAKKNLDDLCLLRMLNVMQIAPVAVAAIDGGYLGDDAVQLTARLLREMPANVYINHQADLPYPKPPAHASVKNSM